jgi:hypothetical protein
VLWDAIPGVGDEPSDPFDFLGLHQMGGLEVPQDDFAGESAFLSQGRPADDVEMFAKTCIGSNERARQGRVAARLRSMRA